MVQDAQRADPEIVLEHIGPVRHLSRPHPAEVLLGVAGDMVPFVHLQEEVRRLLRAIEVGLGVQVSRPALAFLIVIHEGHAHTDVEREFAQARTYSEVDLTVRAEPKVLIWSVGSQKHAIELVAPIEPECHPLRKVTNVIRILRCGLCWGANIAEQEQEEQERPVMHVPRRGTSCTFRAGKVGEKCLDVDQKISPHQASRPINWNGIRMAGSTRHISPCSTEPPPHFAAIGSP